MTLLKHVASVRISNVDKKTYEGEQPVRLCNYTDVYYGDTISAGSGEFMAATASHEQIRNFRLQPGDTVLTKDSETPDDVGISAYIDSSACDFVCGYHLAVVRPDQQVLHPKYLTWSLRSKAVRQQLTVAATGVARYGLRAEALAKIELELPPLEEQRRIADFLDEQVQLLDRAIALRQQQLLLLQQRHTAVTGEEYGRLRARWGTARLGMFLTGLEQGWSPQCEDRPADEGEYGVVKAGCVNGGSFAPEQHKALPSRVTPRLEYLIGPGDLLVSRASGSLDLIGSAAIVPDDVPSALLLCDKVYRLRLARHLSARFLALLLQGPQLRDAIKLGTSGAEGMANNLPGATIRRLQVPKAPLIEQEASIRALSDAREVQREADRSLKRSGDLLLERKQTLITAAVTGQLDVTTARSAA